MKDESKDPKEYSKEPVSRTELAREVAVLQLKLVADGLRDAALIPVSLFAAIIGLIRGGDEPDREFRQVLELGIQTERWINLFGYHKPRSESPAASMDTVIDKVEEVLREQFEKGSATQEAKDAIENALESFNESPDTKKGSVKK
ncbi:MAG TPA: hypothetical protein VJ984_07630 [Xanthomonadales bacterium]|nr:hypothetical protein [Xanthomonadales bacterium]